MHKERRVHEAGVPAGVRRVQAGLQARHGQEAAACGAASSAKCKAASAGGGHEAQQLEGQRRARMHGSRSAMRGLGERRALQLQPRTHGAHVPALVQYVFG